MRRRLLLVLLPLLAVLLVTLEVQLAQMYAASETQKLFIVHLGHAEQYAARAEPILRSSSELASVRHELHAYAQTTPGVSVSVFANDGSPVPGVGFPPPSPRSLAASGRFLVAESSKPPATAWPWRKEPLIVGSAVGRRGPPAGAVVLEVPTDAVRDRVMIRIALLTGIGLGVLALTCALCALPLARWILRPVDDLHATAVRLAAGGLDARANERTGPPELRGLARAFNEMADNLALALQRQRAFVADASHELRNPLATLRLRIEALAGRLGGDGDRDLRLALSESDRLANVVDRLLELARAEATAAERVEFDVMALARRRLAAWEPALAAVGSTARLDGPDGIVSRSSPDALEYALDVLIDNARKFAPGGEVEVCVVAHGAHVAVTVRDDGAGLAASDLASVGQRFWRSPRHRAIPGTGLGLATARTLLEAAGAGLEVACAEHGFAVVIALPAALSAEPPGSSVSPPGEGRPDTSRSPSAG